MSKQCLDVQQMQHLQELGLDTSNASMVWCKYDGEEEYSHLLPKDEDVFERCLAVKYIPAYTLQDVLDALPKVIDNKYKLCIEQAGGGTLWCVYYYASDTTELNQRSDESLIDAAYRLLIWVIENGYISKLPANKNSK